MSMIEKAAHWSRASITFRFLRTIHHFACVAKSRRALRMLDEPILRDIGLTRHEAETEADRVLWDAPMHWRC